MFALRLLVGPGGPPSLICPNLAPTNLNLAPAGPNLAPIWPNLAQLGPNLAQPGPNLAPIGSFPLQIAFINVTLGWALVPAVKADSLGSFPLQMGFTLTFTILLIFVDNTRLFISLLSSSINHQGFCLENYINAHLCAYIFIINT